MCSQIRDGRLRLVGEWVGVDETAPLFGELVVTDDSTEAPDGGLVDRTQFGSGHRLSVGGDQVQAGLDGVVLCQGLDEPHDGEDTQVVVGVGGVCGDVEWPAVDDARELAFPLEVPLDQFVQLSRHTAGSTRTRRRRR